MIKKIFYSDTLLTDYIYRDLRIGRGLSKMDFPPTDSFPSKCDLTQKCQSKNFFFLEGSQKELSSLEKVATWK